MKRFSIAAPEVLLGELEARDGEGDPLFSSFDDPPYSMAELPSGRIVVPKYQAAGPSAEPKAHGIVFTADGKFERRFSAPGPNEIWRGAGVAPDGDLLMPDLTSRAVLRYNPATFIVRSSPFVDELPDAAWSVVSLPSGETYVAGLGYVVHVSPAGARSLVMGLPTGGGGRLFRIAAPYGPDRVVVARSHQSDTDNVFVVRGRTEVVNLRAPEIGGRITDIYGLATLD